jgi:hypothetical protein
MTNPEYILEFMRENDMRFYTLSNSFDRETVKQFNEQSLDDGVRKLERFFKNNKGFFRIKLYSTNAVKRDGVPNEKPTIFEVNLTGEEFKDKAPEGLGSVQPLDRPTYSSPMGAVVGMDKYLDKHEVVSELKSTIVRLEMENSYLKENHAKELEALRKDLENRVKEAQDSNAMFGQGISMIMQRMGVAE